MHLSTLRTERTGRSPFCQAPEEARIPDEESEIRKYAHTHTMQSVSESCAHVFLGDDAISTSSRRQTPRIGTIGMAHMGGVRMGRIWKDG